MGKRLPAYQSHQARGLRRVTLLVPEACAVTMWWAQRTTGRCAPRRREMQVRTRLTAGGKWIRTLSVPLARATASNLSFPSGSAAIDGLSGSEGKPLGGGAAER
jgi:hypothetical protein